MFEKLQASLPEGVLIYNECMSRHTTFRVGGEASAFAEPTCTDQIVQCVDYCRKNRIPFLVIGAGSNLLVSDKGFDGLIIKIGERFNRCKVEGDNVFAEAGISLARLARVAAEAGLSGLEFAEGIPGKLGGGLFMNAGAYGGELNDFVQTVQALNLETNRIESIQNIKGHTFGYRSSFFQKKPYVILNATFKLSFGDTAIIKEKMKELSAKRHASQPLKYPSAGSTFKRPHEEGKYAGALIEQAGLKGYTIGGAQVSEKHAGFIINYNNQATAADIYHLIQHVQAVVYEKHGIQLEPEVRLVGEF